MCTIHSWFENPFALYRIKPNTHRVVALIENKTLLIGFMQFNNSSNNSNT